MKRPVTSYLLLMPVSYMAYCYYQDKTEENEKIQREKAQQSESVRSLMSRYQRCSSAGELVNILKKNAHYLRKNISDPQRVQEKIIDCEIIDSGIESTSIWLYPFHTKSRLAITHYQQVENSKQGMYSLLFWADLHTKQKLVMQGTSSQTGRIQEMAEGRDKKCIEIARRDKEEFQDRFIECVRRTEGVLRVVERELSRLKLMNEFQKYK